MEEVVVPIYSPELLRSSSSKQIKTMKRNSLGRTTPATHDRMNGGLLHAPPRSLSFSYCGPLANTYSFHNPHQQQPPLLPLPSVPSYQSLTNSSVITGAGLNSSSCPRKLNTKGVVQLDPSPLTPKKSKPSARRPNREPKKDPKLGKNLLGPEPNDPQKDGVARKVDLSLSSGSSDEDFSAVVKEYYYWDKFSGSVFSLSPPPSSLPLPRFSVRPKRNCNTKPAGVDPGATDDIRRILRL